jgi:hypothetical protein
MINGFDGNASAAGHAQPRCPVRLGSASRAGQPGGPSVGGYHATSVDVRYDGDIIATLNTTDAITVGADIVVGT